VQYNWHAAFSVFHHANPDDSAQAEYWLKKLDSLIGRALSEPEYKNGTAGYRRYLQCKYAENVITGKEFLTEPKKGRMKRHNCCQAN